MKRGNDASLQLFLLLGMRTKGTAELEPSQEAVPIAR
jgi:hypothetical protein